MADLSISSIQLVSGRPTTSLTYGGTVSAGDPVYQTSDGDYEQAGASASLLANAAGVALIDAVGSMWDVMPIEFLDVDWSHDPVEVVPATVVARLLERLMEKGVLNMDDLQYITNDPTLRRASGGGA